MPTSSVASSAFNGSICFDLSTKKNNEKVQLENQIKELFLNVKFTWTLSSDVIPAIFKNNLKLKSNNIFFHKKVFTTSH